MSEIKHTAEPWEASKIGTTGEYREITANFGRYSGMIATTYGPDCDADARRIVACVNACAGVTTEHLEIISKGRSATPLKQIAKDSIWLQKLREDHDFLLQAMKKIAAWDLPATGKTWESGEPMSYESCYGSNGARDYIRTIASEAIGNSGYSDDRLNSFMDLKAQRDELLAVLKAIAFATAPNPDDGSHHENAYVLATEAIAKYEVKS